MSTRVNLDDLKAGMVLAEDAVHLNGRVLLSSGSCLTDKHLTMFRSWGLSDARISGKAGENALNNAVMNINKEILIHSEKVLEKSFKYLDFNHEPVSELFKLCVRIHANNISNGEIDGHNS